MNSDQYQMLGVLRISTVSTTTSWWSSPRRYRYLRILANTKFFHETRRVIISRKPPHYVHSVNFWFSS